MSTGLRFKQDQFDFDMLHQFDLNLNLWWRVVVFITIAQLYSTKLEIRFCAGSNSAHVMSEVYDCEYLIYDCCTGLVPIDGSFIPEKHFITIFIQSIKVDSLRFEAMQFLCFVNSNDFLCHWKHCKFFNFSDATELIFNLKFWNNVQPNNNSFTANFFLFRVNKSRPAIRHEI